MMQVIHTPHNFNLNHFKIVEDMGLKIITSRSPSMASPTYKISRKSTHCFKSYQGEHRQTGWWFHKPTFISVRQANTVKSQYNVCLGTLRFYTLYWKSTDHSSCLSILVSCFVLVPF
jgi:hypothetical protein